MSENFVDSDFKINNECKSGCSICGGVCCKRMGCHFSPRDFKSITTESLLKTIAEKGYISIDWWEGDVLGNNRGRTYFLRSRNTNSYVLDPSWGGKCMLLTKNGCKLSFDERPMGGRAVIPDKNGVVNNCYSKYSKEECCKEWYEYQDILDQVVQRLQ